MKTETADTVGVRMWGTLNGIKNTKILCLGTLVFVATASLATFVLYSSVCFVKAVESYFTYLGR